MSQPQDFGFGEEEAMLRDSARKFFSDNLATDALHKLVADESDPHRSREVKWRPELWQQMVELGWTMLAVPESAGGLGMNAVAVAALCEEAGRAAFPSPLLATINTTYLLAACDSVAATAALEAIVGGAAATLAVTNCAGSWEEADCDVQFADGKLSGMAAFVQDVQKADYLVVKARHETGLGLYWLPRDGAGVTVSPDAIVDLTRDQGRVQFGAAEATELTADALPALAKAMPAIWTMISADMVGAGEWELQTTAEYARTRRQFDREIGFFQAVKHPLVDAMIEIDQSRSLVYNAACAIDYEPELATRYAHMAKSSASDMAVFVSGRAVQFHGGIGFTWECYVHLYFKRQNHSAALWGDGSWHRARLASDLMDAA
ncbi:MAG: acyl-CoA dehydrogenase family protein [Halieaceae bacterium]|jgi:alkylation response protein AidB-like acyl-CoA dehydrogenase|nr:acyl-CoA dehydrogenase family protein [Halieaceae bacterium]